MLLLSARCYQKKNHIMMKKKLRSQKQQVGVFLILTTRHVSHVKKRGISSVDKKLRAIARVCGPTKSNSLRTSNFPDRDSLSRDPVKFPVAKNRKNVTAGRSRRPGRRKSRTISRPLVTTELTGDKLPEVINSDERPTTFFRRVLFLGRFLLSRD